MNVLSLFDGISCGRIALERAGIKVDNYYASEIKKSAIKCAMKNYPNIVQIGDVTKISYKNGILHTENENYKIKIDMIIGGSPCQDFSNAQILSGNQCLGLKGNKSKLFYEYLRLLQEIKPKYFLLENVRMKDKSKKELDNYLGVQGITINSNLVSYQNRNRCYWTNIPNVTIPNDKKINFQDYKDTDWNYCKQYKLPYTKSRIRMWNNGGGSNGPMSKENKGSCINITYSTKIGCLTRKQDRCPNSGLIEYDGFGRFLTQHELEQAQTVPIGYTDCLSYNQQCDVFGDGWTVDVIAHIFSFLPKEYKTK